MRVAKLLCIFLPLVLCACVYRQDIKQGNFLDNSMIAQVKPGMTQAQVRFVMGPAMIRDPFHPDRWDYVYYDRPVDRNSPIAQEHVVVLFKDDKVVSIEQAPIKPPAGS